MNGGSFFFAEIIRMTSSERPRGNASASTSLTKPWRYSRLIRSSSLVTGELIGLPFALRAAGLIRAWDGPARSCVLRPCHAADGGERNRLRQRLRHLLERDPRKRLEHEMVDRQPVGAHAAGRFLRTETVRGAAFGHAYRTIHRVDDLRDRDLGGRARQPVPAF